MSETEATVAETAEQGNSDNLKQLIYVSIACSGLALIVALISLLLILDMHGDVGITEEQTRRVAKMMRGMQDDVAELKTPSREVHKAAVVEKKVEPPRPTHIDSAAPGQDCVVRPGDPKSFAECLKSGPPSR